EEEILKNTLKRNYRNNSIISYHDFSSFTERKEGEMVYCYSSEVAEHNSFYQETVKLKALNENKTLHLFDYSLFEEEEKNLLFKEFSFKDGERYYSE
ncbi:MAG: hypothetical protein K5694_02130, partial [Bacilli bacterium]|nr:hypothetical protein [Bacilli bacterium]